MSVGNGTRGVSGRVLLLHPTEDALSALVTLLKELRYDVATVTAADAAIDSMRVERFDVLLCDQRLAGASGVDFIVRALNTDREIAVVMLTDPDAAPSAAEILGSGACDYLSAENAIRSLPSVMERAVQQRTSEIRRRNVERAVRETVMYRTLQIEREKAALQELTLDIVNTLIKVQEAKDPFLRGHSERVAALAVQIAEELGLPQQQIAAVRLAARLHDIGMVGIPERILCKEGTLTPEEYEIVKSHVQIGLKILAPVTFADIAISYIRDHHEHYAGGGYPNGAAGEAITIGGRILAAADAYDALTSSRAFRSAFTSSDALEILGRKSGKLLDPRVYDALRRAIAARRSSSTLNGRHSEMPAGERALFQRAQSFQLAK